MIMSSDNLDSGCSSTCESEKSSSDCSAVGENSSIKTADSPAAIAGGVVKKMTHFDAVSTASNDSQNSRSSSQDSFVRISLPSNGVKQRNSSLPDNDDGDSSPAVARATAINNVSREKSYGAVPSSAKNTATRFRFPAVSFFRRKKSSWPTLLSSANRNSSVETTVINNNSLDLRQNQTTELCDLTYRRNKFCHFPSSDCSDPEFLEPSGGSPISRSKVAAYRVTSREDPGPSRDNNGGDSPFCNGSLSCPSISTAPVPPNGAKLKFLREGQTQICKLNHPRTVLGKLTSSKLLRRWENHYLILDDDEIFSKTPNGFMEQPIRYANIEDVHALPQWDCSGDKYCVRMFIPEGSILIQTNRVYSRNQWLYSIQWRRNLYRYRRMIEVSCGRPEVLLKETKCMVEQVKASPLQGDNLGLKSVILISRLFEQIYNGNLPKTMLDPIILCTASLLDTVAAVTELSPWLSRYCIDSPRSRLVDEVLSDVAQHTLKKTMDFGKYPAARLFLQDYLSALSSHNNGLQRVRNFVQSVHGPASSCPHPRVLPNLVSVCLAGIHLLYDSAMGDSSAANLLEKPPHRVRTNEEKNEKLECFCSVFETISEFDDWRLPLASLLQPVPFPDEVLCNETFGSCFGRVLRRMGSDDRCEIHLSVLGVREGKEGWFHLVCPGGPACSDDGELFSEMLKTLLRCCCRRKKFLQNLNAMLGPLQLLALRENEPAMDALCHMLEFEVVEGDDMKLQMIIALQSTCAGKKRYAALCDRQIALRELQQKGGPRKLTLPSKSTDADLAVLLSSGSFGNLEWLSLAFTNVTSTCADFLIKLPSLKYLNLWSTQFGDTGLQLLSEHLFKLQVLNLCETPVTDKGLASLSALKNLRKLNLNSTQLSLKTFQFLKAELPALQEVDVRYTDAWCAEEFIS